MKAAIDVLVAASELHAALKTLARVTDANSRGQVLIARDEDLLRFDCGGVSVSMAFSGIWEGQARVASAFLLKAYRALPIRNSLRLWVVDEYLMVEDLRMPCHWTAHTAAVSQLPLNPTLPQLLATSSRYSSEQLELAGIWASVETARSQSDKLVAKAAKLLEPLGITAADLDALVARRAEELWRRAEGQADDVAAGAER